MTHDIASGPAAGPAGSGPAAAGQFDAYRRLVDARFRARLAAAGAAPLLRVATDGLFDDYLRALPESRRLEHTCVSCRRFIAAYGGLVLVDDDGVARSVLWGGDPEAPHPEAPALYLEADRALAGRVARRPVIGPLVSSATSWGTAVTPARPRDLPRTRWTHFAVSPPPERVYLARLQTAGQAAAERLEDFRVLCRSLAEFPIAVARAAAGLADSGALFRGEAIAERAAWFLRLHEALAAVGGGRRREALLWRAVAAAPPGYCRVRASVLGTVLEDLAAGRSAEAIRARFAEKLDPLQYRRPTAAPATALVDRAEAVVARLGIARSLERRYARFEELEPSWTPPAPDPAPDPAAGGVFARVRPAAPSPSLAEAPPVAMTWVKFAAEVLPRTRRLELVVPARGSFGAFTTAVHADAPPILQWDDPDDRNPVAWYVFARGSAATAWGLAPGARVAVRAVVPLPPLWRGRPAGRFGVGAFAVLEGAAPTEAAHLSLFPECLRSELHEVRKVIEAFAQSGTLGGREDAACGIRLDAPQAGAIVLRAATDLGVRTATIDRWD